MRSFPRLKEIYIECGSEHISPVLRAVFKLCYEQGWAVEQGWDAAKWYFLIRPGSLVAYRSHGVPMSRHIWVERE